MIVRPRLDFSMGAMNRPDRWLTQATWAFVALGVMLRIARYPMNYPLWWDEAFVAVNFLRRDYFDLLKAARLRAGLSDPFPLV